MPKARHNYSIMGTWTAWQMQDLEFSKNSIRKSSQCVLHAFSKGIDSSRVQKGIDSRRSPWDSRKGNDSGPAISSDSKNGMIRGIPKDSKKGDP